MGNKSIHPFETEELACHVTGLDYEKIDADTDIIDKAIYEKFNINIEDFHNIVCALIPLIDVGSSPLTKKRYKGFSDQQGLWLTKIEVEILS